MTANGAVPGQLLTKARTSLAAAKVLLAGGFFGYAASRAYYAMFYVAEAILLKKGKTSSKHAGVIAGFGQEVVKTGQAPAELHQYLIKAYEIRAAGDYDYAEAVSEASAREQVARAEEFIAMGSRLV